MLKKLIFFPLLTGIAFAGYSSVVISIAWLIGTACAFFGSSMCFAVYTPKDKEEPILIIFTILIWGLIVIVPSVILLMQKLDKENATQK